MGKAINRDGFFGPRCLVRVGHHLGCRLHQRVVVVAHRVGEVGHPKSVTAALNNQILGSEFRVLLIRVGPSGKTLACLTRTLWALEDSNLRPQPCEEDPDPPLTR
jgi:hypothetical protein